MLIVAAIIGATNAYWHEEHYEHYPKYKFEYGVHDPHTKDHKAAWEHRDGDHTKGGYTLDEADGTHRVVDYHVEGKSGWNAHVKRIGHAHHPHHGTSYQNYNQY